MNEEKKYLPKATYVRRIILGALLIYIAFTMRDAPANTEGGERILMICSMILFFVIGAASAIIAAKRLYSGEYTVPEEEEDEEDEEDAEDEEYYDKKVKDADSEAESNNQDESESEARSE